PEPGHVALDPGAEGQLAGLMDVVPELAGAGEAQILVGNPARPIIDHEDESTDEQQQPDKPKKTADHAPPVPPRAPTGASPIGADTEIQPRQYFTDILRRPFGSLHRAGKR